MAFNETGPEHEGHGTLECQPRLTSLGSDWCLTPDDPDDSVCSHLVDWTAKDCLSTISSRDVQGYASCQSKTGSRLLAHSCAHSGGGAQSFGHWTLMTTAWLFGGLDG